MEEEVKIVLGNVEEMAQEIPGFEVPPVEYREGLRPGDLAELMFLSDQLDPQGGWAQVDEVAPGWYHGILENGEEIEFGPEHVSDIKTPSPQMGAEKASVWDYFNPGREPRPAGRPSIWDTDARAAWAEQEAARKAAQPRQSFWDRIFRRRPKYELTPIPPEEQRRQERVRPGFLPAPIEVPEEAEEVEAPPPPPAPEIIVPETPEIVGEPINYFDILGPEAEELPPSPGGMIIVPEEAPAPPSPGGLVVAEQPGGLSVSEPVFGVLEAPEARPSGLVVRPEGTVSQPGIYDVLEPRSTLPSVPSAYGVLEPKGFEVALPSDSPFGILEPEGGMVVAQPGGVFDVLQPKGGLAHYVEPPAASPFEQFQPQAAPAAEETEFEEEPKRKKKKKKRVFMSPRSSVQDWKEWILRNFDLEEVWDHIRKNRQDPWFKNQQLNEENTGLPATVALLTWENGDWNQFSHYLDIPFKEIEKYIYVMEKEAEEDGFMGDAYDKFFDAVLQPVSDHLEEAFRSFQPADIRGQVSVNDDGMTEGQTYGIVYYEPMSNKEKAALKKQQEMEYEQEQAEKRESEREAKKLEKWRDKELKKIWGRIPTEKELLPWAKHMFRSDFWQKIKKDRITKAFQREVEEMAGQQEAGVMEVEKIAEEGQNLYEQLAAYFGLTTDIFDVYFKTAPFEQAQMDLWSEVLYPYFQVASEAVTSLKPKGIPGIIEFQWDDTEQEFWLKYLEEGEER